MIVELVLVLVIVGICWCINALTAFVLVLLARHSMVLIAIPMRISNWMKDGRSYISCGFDKVVIFVI